MWFSVNTVSTWFKSTWWIWTCQMVIYESRVIFEPIPSWCFLKTLQHNITIYNPRIPKLWVVSATTKTLCLGLPIYEKTLFWLMLVVAWRRTIPPIIQSFAIQHGDFLPRKGPQYSFKKRPYFAVEKLGPHVRRRAHTFRNILIRHIHVWGSLLFRHIILATWLKHTYPSVSITLSKECTCECDCKRTCD